MCCVVSLLFRTHLQNTLPTNRWPSSPLPALSRGASGMPNVALSIWLCRYSRSHVDTAFQFSILPLFSSQCGMTYPHPHWRRCRQSCVSSCTHGVPSHMQVSSQPLPYWHCDKQLGVVNVATRAAPQPETLPCHLGVLHTSTSDIYTPTGKAGQPDIIFSEWGRGKLCSARLSVKKSAVSRTQGTPGSL